MIVSLMFQVIPYGVLDVLDGVLDVLVDALDNLHRCLDVADDVPDNYCCFLIYSSMFLMVSLP